MIAFLGSFYICLLIDYWVFDTGRTLLRTDLVHGTVHTDTQCTSIYINNLVLCHYVIPNVEAS
jgi:hypothetical protein